jgi:hypothetical protein
MVLCFVVFCFVSCFAFCFIRFPFSHVPGYRVRFSSLILLAMYVCIMFELIHRTIAAALAASLALACLAAIEEKPALEEVGELFIYSFNWKLRIVCIGPFFVV